MTSTQLQHIATVSTQRIEIFLPNLNLFMPVYDITGKLREAAFIAQVLHESGMLKYTREIASGRAYEGRKDLGNVHPGDGIKFKGRGLIQLTGRFNYEAIGKVFGQDFIKNPDLLSTPSYAVKSACWFWQTRGLNELADHKAFETITKRINGGLNGYAERLHFYNKALEFLQ